MGSSNVSVASIFSDIDKQDLQQRSEVNVGMQGVDNSSIFGSSMPVEPQQIDSDVVEVVKGPNTGQSNLFEYAPKDAALPQSMFSDKTAQSDTLQDDLSMYKKLYEEAIQSNKELKSANELLNKQLKECKLKIEFLEKHSKQDISKDVNTSVNPARSQRRFSNSPEDVEASVAKIRKDEEIGVLTAAVSDMSHRVSVLESRTNDTQQKQPEQSSSSQSKDGLKVQQAKISTTSLTEDLVTSAIAKKNKWVANKDSFTADGFTFGYVNDELYVLKVDMRTNKVDIPSYVDGIPVRGILGGAFTTTISDVMSSITCAKTKIDLIYLPKTITHIDRGAFKGVNCTNLIIPASVSYIAKDAFDGLTCDILRFACNQKLITSAIAGASIKTCVRVEEVV